MTNRKKNAEKLGRWKEGLVEVVEPPKILPLTNPEHHKMVTEMLVKYKVPEMFWPEIYEMVEGGDKLRDILMWLRERGEI